MPDKLLKELKKFSRGFLCVNKMENKVRIFLMDEYPIMLIWDGVLHCKSKKLKQKLLSNKILKEYIA